MSHPGDNLANDLATHVSRLTVSQDSSKFVDRLLTNDLLFDIIFDACSPASLARISLTCRIAYGAVQNYIARACDVNALLSRYFSNPLEFRSLQHRTGALVSGSTALQLFLRERYPESDLDVYVRKDEFENVARWVLTQNYKFTPSQSQEPDFEDAVLDEDSEDDYSTPFISPCFNVMTFVKSLGNDPENVLKVQIIGARCTPMEIILKFHSTLVMNVIAWDYAYCLYQLATLEYREAIFTGHGLRPFSRSKFDAIMQKYTSRQFTILTQVYSTSTLVKFGGVERRLVGDEYTWALRLPTDDIASPSRSERILLRDPCVCTAWALHCVCVPLGQDVLEGPHMATRVLEDELVEFCYMDYNEHLASLLQELDAPVKRKKRKQYLDQELIQSYLCELEES